MYFILGILLIGMGLVMLIYPHIFFEMTESWKMDGNGEPSDWYVLSTRIGGVFVLIVGCGGVVAQFFLQ